MLKILLNRISKKPVKLLDFNYWVWVNRINVYRLIILPRYQTGFTSIFNKKIKFVDACTLVYGYTELFEKKIYEFDAKNSNPLIIDCGANIGLSVIFFKQLYPHSSIIAYEADPNIFNTLQFNIDSFYLKDVEALNRAVWISDDEEISFRIEGGYSGRIPKAGEDMKNIESHAKVKTVRLKDIIASSERRIDFLKIDVEGAEADIILDCATVLDKVDHLFIEYHSHIKEKQRLQEILSVLESSGFRYHIKEAFCSDAPFKDRSKHQMLEMDLQLDIYCYRLCSWGGDMNG